MIEDKRLRHFDHENGYDYYLYTPTFGRWLYKNYEHLRFQRWIRYFMEYIADGKYVVYYIAKNDCILGYCFVAPGGRRLKCSQKTDIVLGPYFILPEHRGKGYSKLLIHAVVDKLHTNFEYAFDYISKSNTPSIKATEACGFMKYKELNISRFFRKLMLCDNGEYVVYRKPRNKF